MAVILNNSYATTQLANSNPKSFKAKKIRRKIKRKMRGKYDCLRVRAYYGRLLNGRVLHCEIMGLTVVVAQPQGAYILSLIHISEPTRPY